MTDHSWTWVSPYHVNDARGGWEAMQFHLLQVLEARLGPALRIAPVGIPEQFTAKWISRVQKQFGIPRRYAYYSETRLEAYRQRVESQLPEGLDRPVVFFGALPFVECRPSQPYFIYTDSAFFIHYWEYNQDHTHARTEIERICTAEAEFMRGAECVWCSSQWVVERISEVYGISAEKVRFVGTGPGDVPQPIQPIRYENFLVMIAADFERKGGQLAVKAVSAAREMGADLSIKFIGAKPPAEVLKLPFVEWCGWLDLKKSEDRKRFAEVMSRASAQILLSRIDLTPLAIPEAASYSKATLAAGVGGIPEMIVHGKTGWLVGTTAEADEIGSLAASIFGQSEKLKIVGEAASVMCGNMWSWDAVAGEAVRTIREACKGLTSMSYVARNSVHLCTNSDHDT